jgi:hypothetical protein
MRRSFNSVTAMSCVPAFVGNWCICVALDIIYLHSCKIRIICAPRLPTLQREINQFASVCSAQGRPTNHLPDPGTSKPSGWGFNHQPSLSEIPDLPTGNNDKPLGLAGRGVRIARCAWPRPLYFHSRGQDPSHPKSKIHRLRLVATSPAAPKRTAETGAGTVRMLMPSMPM